MAEAYYSLRKSKDGQFYFNLVADNNETVATRDVSVHATLKEEQMPCAELVPARQTLWTIRTKLKHRPDRLSMRMAGNGLLNLGAMSRTYLPSGWQ